MMAHDDWSTEGLVRGPETAKNVLRNFWAQRLMIPVRGIVEGVPNDRLRVLYFGMAHV